MKYMMIILLALMVNDPIKINKINKAKTEAKNAFQSGDYKAAIEKYNYLIDSLGVKEDEVLLNLANAYYLQKDTANAITRYQSLTQSTKNPIVSKADNQLGLMTNQQGKAEQALNYFKQAIKADPTNDDARFNYEMLKKKLDEKKKQEQQQNKDQKKDQQNKDQQNKDEQQKKDQQKKDEQNKENKEDQKKDQEQKDKQQKEQQEKEQKEKEQKEKEQQQKEQQEKEQKDKEQKKDQQNLDKDKLNQMKISEEKAKMILEAMKNQEKQYLQQNRRKATKSRDRGKPDW